MTWQWIFFFHKYEYDVRIFEDVDWSYTDSAARKWACGNHYTRDAPSVQLDLTEKLPIPLGKVLV